jgi:hypothetical protein
MCRNIRTLYNFTPPATDEEIRAASLQFIRKITGFKNPSKMNEKAFENAVAQVTLISKNLLESLVTTASSRDREKEALKAKARAKLRFG